MKKNINQQEVKEVKEVKKETVFTLSENMKKVFPATAVFEKLDLSGLAKDFNMDETSLKNEVAYVGVKERLAEIFPKVLECEGKVKSLQAQLDALNLQRTRLQDEKEDVSDIVTEISKVLDKFNKAKDSLAINVSKKDALSKCLKNLECFHNETITRPIVKILTYTYFGVGYKLANLKAVVDAAAAYSKKHYSAGYTGIEYTKTEYETFKTSCETMFRVYAEKFIHFNNAEVDILLDLMKGIDIKEKENADKRIVYTLVEKAGSTKKLCRYIIGKVQGQKLICIE